MANALQRTAHHLAFDDQRVHHAPGIIAGNIKRNGDLTGIKINFHFRDMAAIGPGRAGDRACGINENAAFRLLRRQVEKPDAPIRARHLEGTGQIFQINRCHFQSIGGKITRLVHRFVGSDLHC